MIAVRFVFRLEDHRHGHRRRVLNGLSSSPSVVILYVVTPSLTSLDREIH